SGRPEERPGGHDDPLLEQPLGYVVRRRLDPEEHRRRAARDAQTLCLERRQEGVALSPVRITRALDVLLVVPRGNGCTLDELLRRRADRRPVLLERRYQLFAGGDEARAVSGHRRALAECVEDDDVAVV